MRRKKGKGIWLIALLVLAIFAYQQGWFGEPLEFTPVYCTQYGFYCCVETLWQGYPKYNEPIPKGNPIWCPTNAARCNIDSISIGSGNIVKVAQISASCSTNWLGEYHCTGEQQVYPWNANTLFVPGTKIYRSDAGGGSSYMTYSIYGTKLIECGTAGCTQGVEVNANGCSFQITGFSSGEIEGDAKLSGTVPVGQCWKVPIGRYICGNLEEECITNDDCKAGHTLIYNGYGAECTGSTLEWYGCRQYNETGEGGVWQGGTRCEVIGNTQVQCCPAGGQCGTWGTCDPNTFTCKASGEVECTYDWECGVQEYCDQGTKKIYRDACNNGQCSKVEVRSVECCYSTDCPNGYFCDANYQCKQAIPERQTCIFECCENDANYYDKPCAEGLMCCADRSCHTTCEGIDIRCDNDNYCEPEIGENADNCADCEKCEEGEYFDMAKQACLPYFFMIPWDWIFIIILITIVLVFVYKLSGKRGRRK